MVPSIIQRRMRENNLSLFIRSNSNATIDAFSFELVILKNMKLMKLEWYLSNLWLGTHAYSSAWLILPSARTMISRANMLLKVIVRATVRRLSLAEWFHPSLEDYIHAARSSRGKTEGGAKPRYNSIMSEKNSYTSWIRIATLTFRCAIMNIIVWKK